MASNSKQKPIVIVTGPNKRLPFAWWATRFILRRNGLQPIHVTPKFSNLPKHFSGVVLGGGQDIDPSHYGPMGDAGAEFDFARDHLEMRVARLAIDKGIPLMGICRGAQLINIVRGGSLFQDIRPNRSHTPNKNSIFPIKSARISTPSILHSALNVECTRINSLHNQAVDRLGDGVKAVAYDDDNFVQAIESEGEPFFWGVQWHPEYMFTHAVQRRLFAYFANKVKHYTPR